MTKKGKKQKKYSAESKISVIMDMREHHLGYCEMYHSEKFEFPQEFIAKLQEYIHYFNNERISLNLKGMSPVQYQAHLQSF